MSASDPATALLERLHRHGLPFDLIEHPPFFTVNEGREYRQGMKGAHTKNLFLKDKKSRHLLISAHEATEVDLKSMHRRLTDAGLGASGRLSFGSADKMQAFLGVAPGSVTPFGLIHDGERQVPLVLDEALLAYDIVNFHPLRNTATVSMKTSDFISFMELIGHPPLIIDLTPRPQPAE